MSKPHLVLAGLGHAHLFVLEALSRGRISARVSVVSPADYHYSGMIPGAIAGCYTPGDSALPPATLCMHTGATYIQGRVARVDAGRREVTLENGTAVAYDLVSLDIGSRPASDHLPGVREHAIPIKPVDEVLKLRSAMVRAIERAQANHPARAIIVGGGAAGVEIAFCLDAALARRYGGQRFRIAILQAADTLIPEYPDQFRRTGHVELERRGVEIRTGMTIRAADESRVITEHGEAIRYDALLWATGPRAPKLLRDSGLPVDEKGYLRVGPTLQAAEHPEIFGAGDCVTLEHAPWVPKAGVYAVREGPFLAKNLAQCLRREPLDEFEPQRDWLSLMNTGDGRALLHYKGLTHHGRAAWWLKDRIDRRFVRRFQQLGR